MVDGNNMMCGKSIFVTGIAFLSAISMSACSTTSVVHVADAKAAPITYKLDQGGIQNVSAAQPTTPSYSSAPVYTAPVYDNPSAPASRPVMPTLKFNNRSVDRDLYAHQKVGKRYSIRGKSYTPKHEPGYDKTGTASWYGDKFHGRPTATGEKYNMNDITAAHKTLPLNSMAFVTNLETGQGMMVRVNDRGPFVDGRIIDLSRASAQALGLFKSGLAKVRVQYAGPADPMAAKMAGKPTPMPVAPVYERENEPALVVETPNYNQRGYQPLRDLGTPPATTVALPQQQFPFQQANPQLPSQDWRNAVPPAIQPETPRSVQGPHGDEPVTLTITGPVHLASDKTDDGQPKPKFIPAVNYKEIPAKSQ
jgi:rare lipoprotein A